MILQFDAPIPFNDLPAGHAFILSRDERHVMKKIIPNSDKCINATGVFEEEPWLVISGNTKVHPVIEYKPIEQKDNHDLRKSEQAHLEAAEKFMNVSLGIDYETLSVLRRISEKLDTIIEAKCSD